jgi:hypothetical protein
MRQQVATREHFRRGNAILTLIVARHDACFREQPLVQARCCARHGPEVQVVFSGTRGFWERVQSAAAGVEGYREAVRLQNAHGRAAETAFVFSGTGLRPDRAAPAPDQGYRHCVFGNAGVCVCLAPLRVIGNAEAHSKA